MTARESDSNLIGKADTNFGVDARHVDLFLGIDAGASSTTCALADQTGRVRGVGTGGPVDHLFRRVGRVQTQGALRAAIEHTKVAAGLRSPIRSAVAGLTGLDPGAPETVALQAWLRRVLRCQAVRVTWDVEVAFHGAGAGRPGVLVIAGTGSVAYGRNARGETARAGGYGYLADDAGSGMAIGRAGLRAALRAMDGRGPATALTGLVQRQLGDWTAMRERLYGERGGRTLLASLAPLVGEAARRGDPVAREILADAGRALGDLAIAVARRLRLVREPVPIFPVGGIFQLGPRIRQPMAAAIRRRIPRARLQVPILPPVLGAVLMAMEDAGVEVTDQTIRRLRAAPQRAPSIRRR